MKEHMKPIILMLLMMFPLYSTAESIHDKNVAQIVMDFKKSVAPKLSDLYLGIKWKCVSYKPQKNAVGISENLISFESERFYIQSIRWIKNEIVQMPYEFTPTNLDFGLMIFTHFGLAGEYSAGMVYDSFTVIRKFDRELLIEQSGKLVDRFENDEYWKPYFENAPKSSYRSGNRVIAYNRCNILI
jgi:hypothetical protein